VAHRLSTIVHADKPSFAEPTEEKASLEEKPTKEAPEETVSEDDIPF
jgi:hypothetical protein